MALLFHLRTRTKSNNVTNPILLHHLFSTGGDGGDDDRTPLNSNSPFSSYFRDVKDRLKHQSPSSSTPSLRSSSSNFSPASTNSQQTSLEEIRRNLSEFRRRTSVPPPDDPSSSSQQISFQELYKRNMLQNRGDSSGNAADSGPANLGGGIGGGGQDTFDAIRQSLRQIGSAGGGGGKGGDRMSLKGFKNSLRLKLSESEVIGGGTGALPESVFGREMRQKREGDGLSAAMKVEFVRMYSYVDLGEKLRKLRPEGKGKEWFSLGELNERLMRLREMEEKEKVSASDVQGGVLNVVKGVLIEMDHIETVKKPRKASRQ